MNDSIQYSTLDSLPGVHRINPPGLTRISYRAGTYTTVLQRLITTLMTQRDANGFPMLQLDTQAQENWVLGLLQAWALVADVLSFYQERIANEGYLRTATERRSLLELARAIGYELQPGVSASTYLAFMLREGHAQIPQRALIPQGVTVQSVPTQSKQQVVSVPGASTAPSSVQLPQLFETSADFEARAEWNTLYPLDVSNRPGRLFRLDSSALRLAGVKTGLHKGDPLLITGDVPVKDTPTSGGQSKLWQLLTLKTVEPNISGGYTRVTWDDTNQQKTSIANPHAFALQQQVKLYGYPRGSVYYTPLNVAEWSPSGIGLPAATVYVLLQHPMGDLFAATDSGIFRSSNDGESWDAVSSGLVKTKIQALTITEDGQLFAGGSTGNLFRSVDNGSTWQMVTNPSTIQAGLPALFPGLRRAPATLPRTVIRALASYTAQKQSCLAAAMDSGVFLSTDGGVTWRQSASDAPGSETGPRGTAWTFAAAANGKEPLVGMDKGVFPLEVKTWPTLRLASIVGLAIALLLLLVGIVGNIPYVQSLISDYPIIATIIRGYESVFNAFLWIVLLLFAIAAGIALVLLVLAWVRSQEKSTLTIPVRALTFLRNGHVLAGTEQGIFRSQNDTLHWEKLPQGPTNDIRALVTDGQQTIFAGTHKGTVFRSQDNGDHWDAWMKNLQLTDISTLLLAANGLFAAGMAGSTDTDSQWSRFQVNKLQLDLDKVYPTLVPDSWVVLYQENKTSLYKMTSVETGIIQGTKKAKSVTSIRVEAGDPLDSIDRRNAMLLANSEELPLFDEEPIQGKSIIFDRFVPDLEVEHLMIVSGSRLRVRFVGQANAAPVLVSADGLRQVTWSRDERLELMAPPEKTSSGNLRWQLRDRSSFIGYVTASMDAISYEPAYEQDETVSTLVVVQGVQQDEQTTVLLRDPLNQIYDRSTVTCYANVVRATHGQTILSEVLGSVNATMDKRSFTLKRKPLSYLSTGDASNDVSVTLEVLVNDMAWHLVNSLHDQSSSSRVYIVRHDSQQNATLMFGDGTNGAHLPSGSEHITATYRVGSGEAGNVAANSLIMLRTRPPGIQSVTNPLPASGGADAEPLDLARIHTTRQLHALQRIISFNDYQNFAATFAGIGKAQAQTLWDGRRNLLYLTVAGDGNQPVPRDSDLYESLITAISAATPSSSLPVQVDSFELLYFQLVATLVVDADHIAQQQGILANVTSALTTTFSFDVRDFAQSVSLSEVIAVMQRVADVVAVKVAFLYFKDQSPTLSQLLPAKAGRLENGQLLPAQLLLINAEGNQAIDLQVEVQH